MDAIHGRLNDFSHLQPDADGDCHGKATIVEELEDHLDDERVMSFYLNVIANPSEFDLARLAALKVFQVWKAPSYESHIRVGQHLARLLPIEDDVLIQQWMAIAAENFANVPEVFATAGELLADSNVDLDVRHNCLSVIKQLRGTEEAKNV